MKFLLQLFGIHLVNKVLVSMKLEESVPWIQKNCLRIIKEQKRKNLPELQYPVRDANITNQAFFTHCVPDKACMFVC
jgi:hypothetical protein